MHERALRTRRQATDTSQHDLPHTVRDDAFGDGEIRTPATILVLHEGADLDEMAHGLADEERVATGDAAQLANEPAFVFGQLMAGELLEEREHRFVVEPADVEPVE